MTSRNKQKTELDHSLKLIVRSSFIVFIGIAFSKVFSYLYRVITARALGPEIYGLYSLASMILILMISIFTGWLNYGVIRYISIYRGKNELKKIRYIGRFSLSLGLISSIFSAILLFFLAETISINLFHDPQLIIYLRIFAVFMPIVALSGILHSVIRAHEKIGWYSFIGNILYTGSHLAILILLLSFGLKDKAVIFSYIGGYIVMFIAAYLVIHFVIKGFFRNSNLLNKDKKRMRKNVISYSWPLVFFGLVMYVFAWIDSFTIGYFFSASEVGIYNAAVPISLFLLIVPELFMQLFFPLITKEYSNKNHIVIKELSKQIGKWIFIFNLPILIILVFFPGAVINILFGPEYLAAENALRFLTIGIFFYSISLISNNILSMAGKSKLMLFNASTSAVINIILNLILVPKFGITGAAISTSISYVIWCILSITQAHIYVSIVPLRRKMAYVLLVSLIPTLLLIYLKAYIPINLLTLIGQGILFVLLYFLLIFAFKLFDKNDLMILSSIKKKITNH